MQSGDLVPPERIFDRAHNFGLTLIKVFVLFAMSTRQAHPDKGGSRDATNKDDQFAV